MPTFDEARRNALMADLLSLVQGRPSDLLPFEQVRERLGLKQLVDRGVQEVPLDKIVGSVGREHAFNRAFLPREESLRERWEELKEVAEGPAGFSPVELYLVGKVFFVIDGHHRISVARSLGAETIEAHVKEFVSPVILTPDSSIEEVILKSGLADFLETTGLEQMSPDDFRVTIPNGYERLLEHINGHRYYCGIETGGPLRWEEAVKSWQDQVYLPMIEIIRKNGILQEFPEYTETDFYLFTMDHLHHLRQCYGSNQVKPDRAVRHFARISRAGRKSGGKVSRWWKQRQK